jgi:hypothetical protein
MYGSWECKPYSTPEERMDLLVNGAMDSKRPTAKSAAIATLKARNEEAIEKLCKTERVHKIISVTKKRKADATWEDEVAAYKQNLDKGFRVDMLHIDLDCDEVRSLINVLLERKVMGKMEFCTAIGCSYATVNSFLKRYRPMEGMKTKVYINAWDWFKRREVVGLEMPKARGDVGSRANKRQRTDVGGTKGSSATTPSATTSSTATGSVAASEIPSQPPPSNATTAAQPLAPRSANIPKPIRQAASAAGLPDITNIHLHGEDTDSVPVFDTCDEIRRKITPHLCRNGVTMAQFGRDLFAQLHTPKNVSISGAQVQNFLKQDGPRTGAKTIVFYAAYVYFEKLRIAKGEPKSDRREEMEDIWGGQGGFDRETDHRTT